MTTGLVFNMQHYSVHDGDGIRTIIFLKGCPLKCIWCSNPEGQNPHKQLAYNPSKCIGDKCKMCLKKCDDEAIRWSADLNLPIVNFNKTKEDLKYAEFCPAKAMTIYGQEMTAKEVVKEIEKDQTFYTRSGGGGTFSGGEPIMQADFLVECLDLCRARGIHSCIETTVCRPWEEVEAVFDRLDSAYIDLKNMDDEKHKKFTGVSNALILENLKKIGQRYPDKPIRVRTPVIPTFNDTEEELLAIRAFVDTYLPNAEYEILKYHKFGKNKYDFIGSRYYMPDKEIDDAYFAHLKDITRSE